MKTHRVKQGECMNSIAKKYGFKQYSRIYDDSANDELRNKRPNPSILFPGDKVKIPEKTKKEESVSADSKHKFKVNGYRTHLRLLIEELDGTAIGGKAYELEIGKDVYEGTVGGDGLIEQEVIADAKKGGLTVWLDDEKQKACCWPLEIGYLDPPETISGAQGRLNNLGFSCGPVDGIEGPLTEAAVKAFREKHSLSETGPLGDETKNKLKDIYGM